MASYGYTFSAGDTVTPTRLNSARTVSDIVNADIKSDAAIAATKLASDSITNTQIKSDAAIAGSKIAPDFGAQNVRTSGELQANDGTTQIRSVAASGVGYLGTTTNHPVAIQVNNTEMLRITSSGLLDLNNPSASFRVRDASAGNDFVVKTLAGPITAVGCVANVGLSIITNDTARLTVGSTGSVQINALSGTGNRTVYSTATGFLTNSSSDERLKENIASIDDALAKVEQLDGKYYNWKNKEEFGDQRCIGLIAQNVQQVAPELVFQNADGMYGVHYAETVALLVNAVKELSAKVAALEAK